MDQNDNEIFEEQFRKEFEEKVEKRKQGLLEELKSCGKFLDVSAKKLDDNHLFKYTKIALYLHECQAELTVFHIGANSITDRGFIDILTALQWHVKLKEIYIGNNEITEFGIQGLVDIQGCFKQLKILSMSSCSIDDSTFIQLCYALPELKNLQQLQVPEIIYQIMDWYVYPQYWQLIAYLILQQFILAIIHSLIPFFQAMKKNKTIKILFLNDIGMELATIKQMAICLKKNKTLEDLNLGNTGFSDSAASIFWPSLRHLKKLQLWNNHLTDQAIYEFINVLEREDIGLTYVGLQDNEIEEYDLVQDLNALHKQNEIIEKLIKEIEDKEEIEEVDEDKQVKEMIEIEEKLGELEKLNEAQEITKKQVEDFENTQDKTLKHSICAPLVNGESILDMEEDAKDGRLFYYLNQKSRAFSARKIKSQEIQWTVAWRRLNKKIKTDEGAKKRRIRNLKVQRANVGISLEEIRRRRKENDKTRKAQAEQAAREIKDRKQKQIEAQKKKPAAAQKVAQKAEVKLNKKLKRVLLKPIKAKNDFTIQHVQNIWIIQLFSMFSQQFIYLIIIMDPIFYTFIGIGLGFMGSQVVMNNFFKNKQNKNPQQNKVIKKFLPSDIKKAYQQNQISFQNKRPIVVDDQIRKIVKIQQSPAQFDQDDELSQVQDQESNKEQQINNSEHHYQPQTPNFQKTIQTSPNIKLFVTDNQIQQIVTSPIVLKSNKFSASQKYHPEINSSISQSEQKGEKSEKDE